MTVKVSIVGKRSDFERVDKDFYRTIDKRAVLTLLPFLPDEAKYAEPCYGLGDLEIGLGSFGHQCLWMSDLESQFSYVIPKDALELTESDVSSCEMIITNPPWSRPLLHKMIEHLSNLKPTWLLFDADWAHTRQSATLIRERCTDIVSVGRLIWIPGTKVSGKDNCCWYRFDKDKDRMRGNIFHGRD